MVHRPPMIRDQDRVEIRLTREAEYRLPFTFIEALNEGTLFDRPAHVFRDAARQHRLFHVVNRTTENILGTGVVQLTSGGNKSPTQAEVGGLMVHPAARGFGIASLLVKVMMVYAIKESGRDAPDEQYLAHVVDGNGGPLHALLEAGFRPAGHVDIHRGDIDAVIDHMLKDGESQVRLQAFVFDRQAVGKLVLSLWTFVREHRSLITRSDGAGDIRVTVDFSHVIPPPPPGRAGRAAQAQQYFLNARTPLAHFQRKRSRLALTSSVTEIAHESPPPSACMPGFPRAFPL